MMKYLVDNNKLQKNKKIKKIFANITYLQSMVELLSQLNWVQKITKEQIDEILCSIYDQSNGGSISDFCET